MPGRSAQLGRAPTPPHHMTQQGACPRATKATKQPCAEAAVTQALAGLASFLGWG